MIPSKITAGDTQAWTYDKFKDADGEDVLSSEWNLKFHFRKSGAAVGDLITVTGTPNDDDGWDFEKTFDSDLEAGNYDFTVQAINIATPTTKVTVTKGQVKGEASIEGAGSYQGKSQSRQDLEAVQAAIRALVAGGAVQQYTIGNRNIQKMSLKDLRDHEAALKVQVVKEEKADMVKQGRGDPNNLFVRFK